MTANTRRISTKSKSELLEQSHIEIEYLEGELAIVCADRDRLRAACNQWAEVSQTNYQRAKAAEEQLSKTRSVLRAIKAISDQPGIVLLTREALEEQWSKT